MKNLYWKVLLFIIVVFALFSKSALATNISVSGNISSSTTWSADTIKITGNTTVDNGVTLTINPGKFVIFQGHYGLYIQGRLLAVGTVSNRIIFTSTNTTTGWSGIRFASTPTTNDTSQLVYCNIIYGRATGTGDDATGGGIFLRSFSKVIISNCVLSNNYASTYGGAIALYASSPVIINNILCNNQAVSYGGAMIAYQGSSPQLTNNTIVNNSANSIGGAMDILSSTPVIKNCIIWGNYASSYPQIYPTNYGNITYSDVNMPSGVWPGTGNINANPVFAGPSAGYGNAYTGFTANWRLQSTTPCKNKGSLSLSNYLPILDVVGSLRIDYDTLEMGACEYIQSNVLCGAITTTQTLSKYVIISCDVTINNGVVITIPAGAKVRTTGHYKLNVQGRLVAIGTSTSPIIFTAANSSEGWSGIRFVATPATNDTSKFVYCNITYGKANTGSSDDLQGGAVFISNFSKVLISNCTLSNNYAYYYGGAIACWQYSSPVIINNTISNNTSDNYGGGIWCYDHSSPTINNNNITNNYSSMGGGISSYYYSNPSLNNNSINNNSANSGGALFCYYYSNPTLNTNMISNNYASSGGALYISYYSSPLLVDNIICNNQSASAGGAIFLSSYSNPQITNNTITNNLSNSYAGGIYISSSNPAIKNCIIWGNTASSYSQIYPTTYNNITYSDVSGGYTGTGNINSNPQFINPSAGSGIGYSGYSANWGLTSSTPCVNKGSLNVDSYLPLFDFYGNLRIDYDTIDQGASEYIQSIVACGNISTNTTWSNSVIITCNVNIVSSAVLTISAGTRIKIAGQYSLNVNAGKLHAVGSQSNMIKFSPVNMTTGWAGIKFNSTSWAGSDSSKIEYCIIQGGKSTTTYGGAIYVYNFNKLLIRSNYICNNQAQHGGGLWIENCSPSIVNNVIVNNTATSTYAGGLFIYGPSSSLVANNTISYNSSVNYGAGIEVFNSATPIIKNNIIYGNTCSTTGVGKQLYPTTVANVTYNNIEGGTYTGTGNISVNPQFRIPSTGVGVAYEGYAGRDWSLNATSNTCVDGGTSGGLYLYGATTDLKGRNRIFSTKIDIGAFEDMSILTVCGGTISTNTLWNATTIQITCGDVTVASNATLTIAAGTTVKVMGDYALRILGRLVAVGTQADSITFTAANSSSVWQGIRFNNSNAYLDSSKIQFCRIEYAQANSTVVSWLDEYGGGVNIYYYSKMVFTNSTIRNCSANYYGGGICFFGSVPNFRDNRIYNCSTTGNPGGGGIGIVYGATNIVNTIISNCSSTTGGAVYTYGQYTGTFTNCIIVNNSASSGGALCALTDCPYSFINCTIANNYATSNGGGFYLSNNCDITLKNCIVYGNAAGSSGPQFYLNDIGSDPKIYYSNIQGGAAAFAGPGSGANYANIYQNNINASPLFILPSSATGATTSGASGINGRNWSISQGSPCINVGTPITTGLNLPGYDFGFNSRIYNGRIDQGAYENQQDIVICGDITADATWEADTIKVNCDVYIKNSAVLNISPGTIIEFQGPWKLEVQSGSIQAIGTASEPIIFTVNDTTNFSRMDSIRGGWKGIQFNSPSSSSTIDSSRFIFCRLMYGKANGNYYSTSWIYQRGGAFLIYNYNKVLISNCLISNNKASYVGSAIYVESSNPVITGNTICNNSSLQRPSGYVYGGAVWLDDALPTFSNNTIVNNLAQSTNWIYSAGVVCYAASPVIKNCILYGNQISSSSNYGYGEQLYVGSGSHPDVINCDIEDGYNYIIGSYDINSYLNNINSDPKFENPTAGTGTGYNAWDADWSLQMITPCINAGSLSTSGLKLLTTDMNENPRIVGDTIDIGAYELQIHRRFITQHPSAQSVCLGGQASFSAAASISVNYQWQKNGTPISGANSSQLVLTNLSLADSGLYACIMSNSQGSIVTNTATLTIKRPPTISDNPINDTACIGDGASFSVAATGATPLTYQWYNLNGTVSGATSNVYNIVSTTSNHANIYSCVVTNACGTATSNGASLIIHTMPDLSSISSSSSVCTGGTITLSTTLQSGSTPVTYQWYKDNVIITGETNLSYQITNAQASNAGNYYCKATNSCGSDSTNITALTVNTPPAISNHPANTAVCAGNSTAFTVTATGTNLTYQWQENTGSGFNNISNSSTFGGTTSSTLNILSTTSGMNSYQYRCVVSGTCSPPATSNAATLTVNSSPSITNHPANASVCSGGNASFSVSVTGSNPTYQWQVSSGSAFSNLANTSPYSGVTTATLSITGATSQNGYQYRCVVSGSCSPTATSNAATLTVDQAPSITSQPSSISICSGNSTAFTIGVTGTSLTYAWQVNTGTGFANVSNSSVYSGATSSTLIILSSSSAMNGYIYRCIVTGTCAPAATSSSATLTVNSAPAVTNHPSNTSVCAGSNTTLSVSATGTGITYQWQVNSGSGFSNLANTSPYSTVTTATLTITGATSGLNGYQYRCIISGTCSPAATSNAATLTVNTAPAITSHPSNTSVCAGSTTAFSISSTGTGLTHRWQVNTGSGYTNLVNSSLYSGATSATLTILGVSSSMNNYLYRCIDSGTCTPPAISNGATLTVNDAPSITNHPSSTSICAGNNTSISVSASGTSITYQWQVNSGSGFSNLSNSSPYSGVTTATLTITGATSGLNGYQYRCIINGTCSPAATSNAATLTVNTAPAITSHPSNTSVCAGSSTAFSVSATGTNLTYRWQVNTGSGYSNITNSSVYSGATTSTLTILSASSSMNGYLYRCIDSGTCTPPAISNGATITVNSAPSITSNPSNSSVCSGSNTSFSVSATGTSITYQWQVDQGSGYSSISNNSVYSGATTSSLGITGATSGMNGYQYRCIITGSCTPAATSNSATLTVNLPPSITSQPSSISVCSGNTTAFSVGVSGTNVTYRWQVNTGSGYSNLTNSSLYSGATTSTLTILGANSGMNGYLYRCVDSGTCSPPVTSNAGTLTINDAPVVTSQPSNTTVCSGSNTTISVTATGTNLTYQWQVNTGTGYSNISNTSPYSNVTTSTLTITGASAGLNGYMYRCIVSGTCSPAASSNAATLTINTAPSISSHPTNTSVCAGNTTAISVTASGSGLAYQWQVNTGSGYANISNNSTYSGATSSTLSIYNVTSSMNSYTYQCIVSGTCSSGVTSNAATLTVNTAPSISNHPANTSVCSGSNTSLNISASGTTLTYQWQLNSGSGFNNISNTSPYSGATTATLVITGATTGMNSYQYRCIVSGACSPAATSNTATLTVNSAPSITSQPANISVCSGNSTAFSINVSGSNITYRWQLSTNSGTSYTNLSNTSTYSGATSSTLTILGVTSAMNGYLYRCVDSGTCTPPVTSNAASLTVNDPPYITNQPANTSVCSGSNTSISLSASGSSLTYQWQLNSGSGFSNLSNTSPYSGVTTATLTLTGATAGMNNYQYRCVVSGTCSPPATSNTATLTVNSAPSITSNPSNTSVCAGSTTAFSINASGTNMTYRWQVNTGSGFSNISNSSLYSGATSTSLTILSATASMNGYLYRCIDSGICSPPATSNSATLTVNDLPFITSSPSNSTVCSGSNTSFSVSATGTSLTYQWQVNTGSGFSNLSNSSPYSNVTTSTLSITGAAAGLNGYQYRCIVSGACSPAATSNAATITINAAPAVTSQPSNTTVCEGNNTSFSVTASGTNLTYQWQVNTGSGFADITNTAPYSSTTSPSLSITNVTPSMNSYQYRCNISGICSPVATTNSVSLTVNTLPTITSQPANSTVCVGANTTFALSATGTGLTYQWQVNTGSGFTNISNSAPYSNATTATLNITSASAALNGYQYRCIVSGTCSPPETSNIASITVNAAPAITGQPSNLTICTGSSAQFAVNATGTAPLYYQWYSPSGAINGATSNVLVINNASSTNAVNYYCVITNVCNASGLQSNSALLTVNQPPAITAQSGSAARCIGQSMTFSVTASGTSPLNYQWYHDTTSISGATNNIYNINSVATTDAGNYFCVVTNSCGSDQSTSKVLTVNTPVSITSQTANTTICSGQPMTFSVATSGSAPVTYQWYFNFTAISGATNNTYTILSSNSANIGTYYCRVSNTCNTSQSNNISLTVNSAPAITSQSNSATRCVGQSQTFSITASGSTPLNYQWYHDTALISGATNNTFTINSITVADGGNYFCIVTNSCGSAQSTPKTLTVNTPPDITAQTANTTKCSGQSITFDVSASGTSPLYYQWYHNGFTINGATSNYFSLYSIIGADSGLYYCIASNVCGNDKSADIVLKVNTPVSVLKQSRDTSRCVGDATLFDVQIRGTEPVSYRWHFENDTITGAHSSSYFIKSLKLADAGNYFCEMTNVCGTIQGAYKELSVKPLPDVHLGNDTTFCLGNSIDLITDGPYYCKWSTGSTRSYISVTHSGDYFVHVTDPYGCQSYSDTIHVNVLEPFAGEVICVVTVDSSTGKNLIAWERTKGYRIAYYNVYKETTQAGVYQKIGSLPFDSLSVLIDNNSNPRKKAERYSITAVDSCGNESDYSPFHKTIHLTASTGTSGQNNLNWSHYEGFPFQTYRIYRGTSPSNMTLFDSVASNINSYSDIAPPTGAAYYQVTAVKLDLCKPAVTRAQTNSGPYSQSASNLKDYSQTSTLYITASPYQATAAWQEGSYTFYNIYTNLKTPWQATTSAWWISLSKDYANNTLKAVTFMNYSFDPRMDTIKIFGEGVQPQHVILVQDGTVGIHEVTPDIELKAYPNPFNYSTNIEYELKNEAKVTVEVYNMVGNLISSVVNQQQMPGKYIYTFNEAKQGGVYILRTVVNNKVFIKKLIKTN